MRSRLPGGLALLLVCAGAARAAPVDPAAALPGAAALPPLVRLGPVVRHTAETLWERIDGEAEVYKSYGLAASAHALYEVPEDPDRRVDLSVYAFAEPLGAFGVFAAFRPPDCTGEPLGSEGCVGDYQGFFWHGHLFVIADAAGLPATRRTDLNGALAAAAALLGPPPPRPSLLSDFSRLVDPHTIRYQPRHLLGRAALPPGLEGTAGGTPIFVSTGAGVGESAAAVLDSYADVLEGAVRGERNGAAVLSGRDPALGEVTLVGDQSGVRGARAASDAPGVQRLLEALDFGRR